MKSEAVQKVTYRVKFIRSGELYPLARAAFDENGKMKELEIYTSAGVQSVNPNEYEIVYVFDQPSEEEIEKIVKEDKKRNDKFKFK